MASSRLEDHSSSPEIQLTCTCKYPLSLLFRAESEVFSLLFRAESRIPSLLFRDLDMRIRLVITPLEDCLDAEKENL